MRPSKANVLPDVFSAPLGRTLYWPMDTGSGVITGSTTQSGFNAHGAPSIGLDVPLTLTVTSGTVSYSTTGGLIFPSGGGGTAYGAFNPSAGASRDFIESMLDLETLLEGESLLVMMDMTTPANWGVDKITGNCMVCVGQLDATLGNRGYSFELTTTEVPIVTVFADGRSAGSPTSITPSNGSTVPSGGRSIVGWQLEALENGALTCRLRTYVLGVDGILGTSSWSDSFDMTEASNGGTGVPGLTDTSGIRVGRRHRSGTPNQCFWSERISSVIITRWQEEEINLAFVKRAMLNLLALPNNLPSTIRQGEVNVSTLDSSSEAGDGTADRTFGNILRSDMFLYIDGAATIASHPKFSVEIEAPMVTGDIDPATGLVGMGPAYWTNTPVLQPNGGGKYHWDTAWLRNSLNLEVHPLYTNTVDWEGVGRWNPEVGVAGDHKFGRVKTGTFANSFLFSAFKPDQNYGTPRGRSMLMWHGGSASPVHGVEFWHAMRWYFDIDEPTVTVGNLLFWQIFAQPWRAGMFPPMHLTLDTQNNTLRTQHAYSTVSPSIEGVNTISANTNLSLADYPTLLKRWVDVCVKIRCGTDVALEQPYVRYYIDDTLVHSLDDVPIGYMPLLKNANTGIVYDLAPMVAMGAYPPSTFLTPNTERNIYLKRGIVCKNEGGYTLADMRAALDAP